MSHRFRDDHLGRFIKSILYFIHLAIPYFDKTIRINFLERKRICSEERLNEIKEKAADLQEQIMELME